MICDSSTSCDHIYSLKNTVRKGSRHPENFILQINLQSHGIRLIPKGGGKAFYRFLAGKNPMGTICKEICITAVAILQFNGTLPVISHIASGKFEGK